MEIIKQENVDGYIITEYSNGTVIKEPAPIEGNVENPITEKPNIELTLEDKINFLYYKEMGLIQ